jgi:hypothetical protein
LQPSKTQPTTNLQPRRLWVGTVGIYYGTTVTEQQIKAQADAMDEHLLPSGYTF